MKKWKFLAKTAGLITAFLGIKEIPVDAEKKTTDFSAEQKKELETKFGAEKATQLIEAFDKELKAMESEDNSLQTIDAEIRQLLASAQDEDADDADDLNEEEDEDDEDDENEDGNKGKKPNATSKIIGNIGALTRIVAKQKATIDALVAAPEDDVKPKTNAMNRSSLLAHSATHLFASNKSYDAFEKRPWNQRLRDASGKATDFQSDSRVPLLQDDTDHFIRENPTVLNSLFNDYFQLPKEWDRRTGVLDRVADGYIIPAEIVQGRSKGYNPKNKFGITAEEGKVFRKKIDIEFDGYELQQIETTWINSYNKEGSHPYKNSFVYFLLSELVKRQMADDRKAQINGVFVQTPDGDGYTGAAINSQNGLMYLFHQFRDVKKQYRAFDIGVPTKENIVDYIKTMIEMMPEEERLTPGLEIGLSFEKLQWYRERAGLLYQHLASTDEGKLMYTKNHPIDYPNFIFQPLIDHTKSDFIYIIESKNIQTLDYDVSEKGKFTFEALKRNMFIFADYRLGIRIKFVGMKLAEGDPREFEVQKVWSNNAPILNEDIKAPVYDDSTGIIKLTYNNVKIDENFKTDITEIEGIVPGQILKIHGNKNLASAKKLKSNAKISLTADYALNTEGSITLLAKADGTFKELTRTTTAPSPVTVSNSFTEGVLDAEVGTEFYFTGVADDTLDEIINGVEGKTIKVFGTDKSDVELTVATGNAKIVVATNAVLATKAHFIELINVSGVWYEVSRLTA